MQELNYYMFYKDEVSLKVIRCLYFFVGKIDICAYDREVEKVSNDGNY